MLAGRALIVNRQLIDTRFRRDPELNFTHSGAQALLQLWELKRRGRAVPDRADIDVFDLRGYLPRIIIYDAAGDPPRFRFRLYGTLVSHYSGRDPTGRFLDEIMSPEASRDYHEILSWICETQQPLRTTGTLHYLDRSFVSFESVSLPVSARGDGTVDQILSAVFYEADQAPG